MHSRLFDKQFKSHKITYLLQSLLATSVVLVILSLLNAFANAAVIASIGATSFIVFTSPHQPRSQARYVLGGYGLAIVIGTLCFWLSQANWQTDIQFLMRHQVQISASLAVGTTMFIMVVLNVEHPPAAGFALGLLLDEWTLKTIVVTMIAVLMICLAHRLLKRYMRDLL